MRRLLATSLTFVMLILAALPARPDTLEFYEFSGFRPIKRQIKWPNRRISIALSTSLNSPGPNLKIGSDVIGAARRALGHWSGMANLTFVDTFAPNQSISSATGDGISLITIADTPENNAIFGSGEMTGRTRLFYDADSGVIVEADICINPHPTLNDGTPVQFSTDGSPGTYDLESTFTHEIGHLLGLDHSPVMASTMQGRQGLNGVYGFPAFTGRTLSEEDRERVRSLYGPLDGDGALEGKVLGSYSGAQVWAESSTTGRVVGGGVVSSDGSYRIDALAPGPYRVLIEQSGLAAYTSGKSWKDEPAAPEFQSPVRATEVASQLFVNSNSTTTVGPSVVTREPAAQILRPRLVGINGEMSTIALPLEAGKSFTVFIGGEGVDQVPGTAISVNSPYFKIDPGSLTREQSAPAFPVVSFEVTVAANAPFGDYSIRLQSNSGEVAHIPGCITIDPAAGSTAPNPVDDAQFFVRQHYRDFLGREPDRDGLRYWVSQLERCGSDVNCIRSRRLGVSTAFSAEPEFQEVGSFIYGLYRALGRRPTFVEFSSDRSLAARLSDIESKKRSLAVDFVGRSEFLKKYPSDMSIEKFVDALLAESFQNPGDAPFARSGLLALHDGSDAGRAAIVSRIVASPAFRNSEYDQSYILLQYFAYFRRDPDEPGYRFWLSVLQSRRAAGTEAFRGVNCAFLNSVEYQSRFGVVLTHSNNKCGR